MIFSGVVGSFAQLLLVRIGVAVGESGCVPTAQSLIADYFHRAERPRAMAIYWMCGPVAVIIGYFGGGWLVEHVGWRVTFMLIGVLGILLALLVKFTIREPRKKSNNHTVYQPPLKSVIVTLWRQRTYRSIVMAFSAMYFFGMGLGQWLPTFFIRSYDMNAGELGLWFAFVWGGCSLIGTYLGGYLATRYALHKEALQMRVTALLVCVGGLLYMMIFLSSNRYDSLAYMAIVGILHSMGNGVIFSSIQSLVTDHMRSVSLAFIFLMANLIGFGLGPFTAGILSDFLAPRFERESLRYALAALSPGYIWAGSYYWKAASTINEDIQTVESVTFSK